MFWYIISNYRDLCDCSKYERRWADGQEVACPDPFKLIEVSCRKCPLPLQKTANRKAVSVDLSKFKIPYVDGWLRFVASACSKLLYTIIYKVVTICF